MMMLELTKHFWKSGKTMRFNYSGDKNSFYYKSKYCQADGQKVTIIRALIEEETGDLGASSIYLVKVPNGGTVEAFEDELVACRA